MDLAGAPNADETFLLEHISAAFDGLKVEVSDNGGLLLSNIGLNSVHVET